MSRSEKSGHGNGVPEPNSTNIQVTQGLLVSFSKMKTRQIA